MNEPDKEREIRQRIIVLLPVDRKGLAVAEVPGSLKFTGHAKGQR
jgi:hypothetical protein